MIIFRTIVTGLVTSFDRLADLLEGIETRLGAIAIFQERIAISQEALVTVITNALDHLSAPSVIFITSGQSIHIPGLQQGEDMSYTVQRDHPDEPYVLDPVVAADSEGPVEGLEFTERLESSNPDVVSDTGSAFHFGTNGGATVNRIVTFQTVDYIIASAVFNVTPGGITFSGTISVPGLTPDPEPVP